MAPRNDPPREAEQAVHAPEIRTLSLELEAARRRITELSEDLVRVTAERDALRDAPPVPVTATLAAGEERYVLLQPLQHGHQLLPRDALLPFDPADPPKGYNGLVEGRDYVKRRVLVAPRV